MKKKVLFLCIGNSCRSQMAEGFARRYGTDVMEVRSAGLAPAGIVQPLTQKVMEDKNINIDDQYPKELSHASLHDCDLIINMSGSKLPPQIGIPVREWRVDDPIGRSEEVYVRVRDEIEMAVMQLILEIRKEIRRSQPPPRRKISPLSAQIK